LLPIKVGRRPGRNFETTQKKDRQAINAAFKSKIADDSFSSHGTFGRRSVATTDRDKTGRSASALKVEVNIHRPEWHEDKAVWDVFFAPQGL
jgi:hypothetical protein